MRKIAIVMTMLAFGSTTAFGLGIPLKLKSKKVQGDLIPSYHPIDTGAGTGDDEGDDPAFVDNAAETGTCTFTQGKFKVQVGKDASIKLSGVECSGSPYTGNLCAHTKGLNTIMDEEIDKDGNPTPKTCISGIPIQGDVNFSTSNIGLVACVAGKCQGTLPTVTADPCPDVDKVSQLSRVEVFDGDDSATLNVLGTNLKACCGTGQTVVGATLANTVAPCNTSTQEPFAEMGTVVQGIQP